MAEGDVLQDEPSACSEGGSNCEKDDFEHPNMLYSGLRNGNDTKADGILGRDRVVWVENILESIA